MLPEHRTLSEVAGQALGLVRGFVRGFVCPVGGLFGLVGQLLGSPGPAACPLGRGAGIVGLAPCLDDLRLVRPFLGQAGRFVCQGPPW